MVATHPVTGRRLLNVNRGWTTNVKGLNSAEARHLLEMLFDRAERRAARRLSSALADGAVSLRSFSLMGVGRVVRNVKS